jgi:UDP-N-acetylmuramoyl-tripeptide--D-alanyl-D-alanine ligase
MFRPYKGRFRLEEVGGFTLIDDTYNANPASTGAALSTLGELKRTGSAFVALGDMLELGGNEAELHRTAGVQAAAVADRLYLVGTLTAESAARAIEAGMPADCVISGLEHEAVANDILKRCRPGDIILLKGSRGMHMEKIAEAIRRKSSQES